MIDAVITFLEVQVETKGHPLGQYIVLNFIDMYPNFPKVNSTVQATTDRQATDHLHPDWPSTNPTASEGIDHVHHEWTFKKITEKDDLSQYEITWH